MYSNFSNLKLLQVYRWMQFQINICDLLITLKQKF